MQLAPCQGADLRDAASHIGTPYDELIKEVSANPCTAMAQLLNGGPDMTNTSTRPYDKMHRAKHIQRRLIGSSGDHSLAPNSKLRPCANSRSMMVTMMISSPVVNPLQSNKANVP